MKPRTRKALPGTLLVTLIIAVMPARWLGWLEWAQDVSNVALMPIRHGVAELRDLAFPPHRTDEQLLEGQSIAALYDDAQEWRRRYRHAELKIRDLEDRLEQIHQIPVERFSMRVRTVPAAVTSINLKDDRRFLEVNRGLREGVRGAPDGTVAVVDGVHLVGRVTEAYTVRSIIQPLAYGQDMVDARVMPAKNPELPMAEAPRVQLSPVGNGTLSGTTSNESGIKTGDTVLLEDGFWPPTAQAMVIGTVYSVEPKDQQPIHSTIIVRPRYPVHRMSDVYLLCDDDESQDVTNEETAP